MGGVHVHQDQALGVLGQDVDALELGQGIAQRWNVALLCRQGRSLGTLWQRREKGLVGALHLGHRRARIGLRGGRVMRGATRPATIGERLGRWRRTVVQDGGGQAHLALGTKFTGGRTTQGRRRRGRHHGELVVRADVAQGAVQGAVEEVVHLAAVAEAHLVFGGMDVDVHHRRIHFQEQHEGRVAAVVENVAIGLAHRMGDQLVAHHAAVDIEVLQIRLAARKGRQTDPAPEAQTVTLVLQRQGLFEKGWAADRADPAALALRIAGRMQGQHALAVVPKVKPYIEAGQR